MTGPAEPADRHPTPPTRPAPYRDRAYWLLFDALMDAHGYTREETGRDRYVGAIPGSGKGAAAPTTAPAPATEDPR